MMQYNFHSVYTIIVVILLLLLLLHCFFILSKIPLDRRCKVNLELFQIKKHSWTYSTHRGSFPCNDEGAHKQFLI